MSEPEPVHPPPSGSLAGCALFTIGLLLVVPSGLCTAIGGVGLAMQLASDPAELASDFNAYIGFVVLTLTCLVAGILLIRAALRARRS